VSRPSLQQVSELNERKTSTRKEIK